MRLLLPSAKIDLQAELLRVHYHRPEDNQLLDIRLPCFLLTVILESSNRIWGEGFDVTLHVGDALLIPPELSFNARFQSPKLYVINLQLQIANAEAFFRQQDLPLQVEAQQGTDTLGRYARECLRHAKEGEDALSEMAFGSLLLEFLSLARTRHQRPISSATRQAIDLIRSRLSKPPSRDEIALRCGVSPNYLSSLFARETGLTLMQFIRRERIAFSKRLILESVLTFTQIAEKIGLDPYAFSRLFKAETGISPTTFRRTRF